MSRPRHLESSLLCQNGLPILRPEVLGLSPYHGCRAGGRKSIETLEKVTVSGSFFVSSVCEKWLPPEFLSLCWKIPRRISGPNSVTAFFPIKPTNPQRVRTRAARVFASLSARQVLEIKLFPGVA